MENYFIGVDGGGTKTEYALIDSNGNVVDIVLGGPSNHEALKNGYDDTYYELYEHIHYLLEKHHIQIDQIKDAVLGLAGVDFEFQHEVISNKIRKLGINNFFLCNDGFLGVKAGSEQGVGINANSGTGICCAGIDESGNMIQIGGIGSLSGDFGGGYAIANQVYQKIYHQLFMFKEKTVLTEIFMDKYQLSNRDDFLSSAKWRYSEEVISFVKDLCGMFFYAIEMGDKPTIQIMEKMVMCLTDYISAVEKNLQFQNKIKVIMSGSIHTKAATKTYFDAMKSQLNDKLKQPYSLITLQEKPVIGTVRWIKERNSREQK